MRELLPLAIRIAQEAGELAQAMRPGAHNNIDTKTTPTDVVTAADRAVEKLVAQAIMESRPDDGILGEEGNDRPSKNGIRWVIDPIDGTVNYLYGHPHYAISIAAELDGQSVVGVVRNPVTGEQWHAVRGEGAWRGDRRLRCSQQDNLEQALIGTGFAYDARRRARQADVLRQLLPVVRDVRRGGTCALDLCYVAEGRLDGYYEQGGQRWDFAAGSLIVTEAGGIVSGLRGAIFGTAMTLAAGAGIHPQLHDRLVAADADNDPLGEYLPEMPA